MLVLCTAYEVLNESKRGTCSVVLKKSTILPPGKIPDQLHGTLNKLKKLLIFGHFLYFQTKRPESTIRMLVFFFFFLYMCTNNYDEFLPQKFFFKQCVCRPFTENFVFRVLVLTKVVYEELRRFE